MQFKFRKSDSLVSLSELSRIPSRAQPKKLLNILKVILFL